MSNPGTEGEMPWLLSKMLLKAADLGHLASPVDVHQRWVKGLEEELFRQGDREKALGLPVSLLMDRQKDGISKSQVGFFNAVAMPMYETLAQAFPGTSPLMNSVKANMEHWQRKQDAHGS